MSCDCSHIPLHYKQKEKEEKVKEEIIEKIKKLETKDNEAVKVVEEMKKAGVKVLRNNELVLKERKMYIPKNENLRLEMILLYYDTLIVNSGR